MRTLFSWRQNDSCLGGLQSQECKGSRHSSKRRKPKGSKPPSSLLCLCFRLWSSNQHHPTSSTMAHSKERKICRLLLVDARVFYRSEPPSYFNLSTFIWEEFDCEVPGYNQRSKTAVARTKHRVLFNFLGNRIHTSLPSCSFQMLSLRNNSLTILRFVPSVRFVVPSPSNEPQLLP